MADRPPQQRPWGFSSGSLSKGKFKDALAMLAPYSLTAVEVSALREAELPEVVAMWPTLDLGKYEVVSLHAPSRLEEMAEGTLVQDLAWFAAQGIPVVVHPDIISDFSLWQRLGSSLLVENMDRRKPIGRTADELSRIFEQLPDARLCLDLGHAKQIDHSMHETRMILKRHGSRLAEVHLSDVNSLSGHEPLNELAIYNFQRVSNMIPPTVPIILESPVAAGRIELELKSARRALPVVQMAPA